MRIFGRRRPVVERPGVGPQRPRPAARGAAGERLAALLVEVAPLGSGSLAGHVHPVRRALVPAVRGHAGSGSGSVGGGPRRSRRSSASAPVGVGRRRRPRCRRRCRARARAGCGPAGPRAPRRASPRDPPRTGRPRPRSQEWKKNADRTAAIGMPKIAPGMPAIRSPMRTEPRTTIGWIPTASCMSRGWRTFMTTNQPMPMRMIAGTSAPGHEEQGDDDRRRPGDERAEERDRHEDARRRRGEDRERQAEDRARRRGRPRSRRCRWSAWPRRKPPNERPTDDLQEARLLGVGRRDEAEQERQDLVAVDDHVDRQEEDDQQRAERADAGDRDLLERPDQRRRRTRRGCRGRSRPGRRGRPGRARASPASACHGARIVGQVLADAAGSRRRTRVIDGRQRAGDDDDERQQDRHRRACRRGSSRRPAAGAGCRELIQVDDRAEDEGEQPGQEERQQDVAEDRPKAVGDQADRR